MNFIFYFIWNNKFIKYFWTFELVTGMVLFLTAALHLGVSFFCPVFVLLLCCCRICTHWQYKLYTFSCFSALSAQILLYLSAAVHCRAPLAQVVSAVLITTRQWTQGRARTDHNILLCRASLLRTLRQLRQILQILTHGGNISSSLHHGHLVNYVRGSQKSGRGGSQVQ